MGSESHEKTAQPLQPSRTNLIGCKAISAAANSGRIFLSRIPRLVDSRINMGWFYLSIAIVFEVVGTTQLKRTDGNFFTPAGMWMLLFYAVSFFMLTLALKNDIEVGVGYAIWSGVGTALIAIIGVLVFSEQASVMKFLCITMIIMGVVGLKLNTISAGRGDPKKTVATEPVLDTDSESLKQTSVEKVPHVSEPVIMTPTATTPTAEVTS